MNNDDGVFTFNGMAVGGRGYLYYHKGKDIIIALAANASGDSVDLKPVVETIAQEFSEHDSE